MEQVANLLPQQEDYLAFALKQHGSWRNEPKGWSTSRHQYLLRVGQTAKGAIPKKAHGSAQLESDRCFLQRGAVLSYR